MSQYDPRNKQGIDQRTVLAVVLCVAIWWGWLAIFGPPIEPELVEAQTDVAEEVPVAEPVAVPVSEPETPRSDLPIREVPFQACAADLILTTDGGGLDGGTLRDFTSPYQMEPLWTWVAGLVTGESETPWKPYGDPPGQQPILSGKARALSPGLGKSDSLVRMEVLEENGDTFLLRGLAAPGLVVEQRIEQAETDPCTLDVTITWHNESAGAVSEDLWVGLHDDIPDAAGGMMARYYSVLRAMAHIDGEVQELVRSDVEDGPVAVDGPVSWFGMADRYFGLIAIPEESSGDTLRFTSREVDGEVLYGHRFVVASSLQAGESHSERFRVYVGALDLDILPMVNEDLGELVYFGWFAIFAYPLLWLLKGCYYVLGNWGLAIIALTVIVKALFFPLTQTAFRSSQAMQTLQPKMQEIREKYADDQERMNREIMALFQENKVNPLGGCLPMLIQLPVWIALYNVLLNVVELYHSEFLFLRDLSAVDPFGAIAAVVVMMMLVQQRFTPTGNMDPAQARMLKLMPLVFGILFFTFPSGLVIYIFCNTGLSILQQWLIKRQFGSMQTTEEST